MSVSGEQYCGSRQLRGGRPSPKKKRELCGSLVSPVCHRKCQRATEGTASLRDAPLETAAFHMKDVSRGRKTAAQPF